jgi:hypothetical protein
MGSQRLLIWVMAFAQGSPFLLAPQAKEEDTIMNCVCRDVLETLG